MEIFRTGLLVAAFLAIGTVVEYWVAAAIDGNTARLVVLSVTNVAEALAIVWYYMHFYRLWRQEGSH